MANVAYVTTVCGILKIVEVITSLIALICSAIYGPFSFPGFLIFVAVASILIEAALFTSYVFQLNEKINAPWFYIDLVTSGVFGLLNFIAFCVAAAYGIIAAFGAAAFFFAVMLVVLAVDAYFLWRGKSSQPSFAIPHTKGPSYVGEGQPVAPSDTPNKIPDYSAEQSRMEP
uniref:Membrane-associating domain n=1 Tax=Schistocephalus solidus TaxID=70667 RepID=A0A0X3PJ50_SCHSO